MTKRSFKLFLIAALAMTPATVSGESQASHIVTTEHIGYRCETDLERKPKQSEFAWCSKIKHDFETCVQWVATDPENRECTKTTQCKLFTIGKQPTLGPIIALNRFSISRETKRYLHTLQSHYAKSDCQQTILSGPPKADQKKATGCLTNRNGTKICGIKAAQDTFLTPRQERELRKRWRETRYQAICTSSNKCGNVDSKHTSKVFETLD